MRRVFGQRWNVRPHASPIPCPPQSRASQKIPEILWGVSYRQGHRHSFTIRDDDELNATLRSTGEAKLPLERVEEPPASESRASRATVLLAERYRTEQSAGEGAGRGVHPHCPLTRKGRPSERARPKHEAPQGRNRPISLEGRDTGVSVLYSNIPDQERIATGPLFQ